MSCLELFEEKAYGLNKDLVVFGFLALSLLIFGLLGPSSFDNLLVSWLMGFNVFFLSILMFDKSIIKYISSILFLSNIFVLFLAFKNGFNLDFGNNIIQGKSRNYVSGTLIIFTIYYLTLCRVFSEKISLVLLFLLFLNSIFLYGRSGIAISLMLLIFSLYYRLGKVIFSIISASIILFIGGIYAYVVSETNFAHGLDTPRSALSAEYLYATLRSDYGIFFGMDLTKCCSLIASYDFNPHNSFIKGHSIYGVMSFFIVILITVLVTLTKRLDILFLLLVLYLRYYLDVMGIFTYYDIVLFTILYFSILANRKHISITSVR